MEFAYGLRFLHRGVKTLTMPCAEEINFGFVCTGFRPHRNMQKKPFIKMLPADMVEWHKPKTREKSRLGEVFKRIIVRKNPQGDQIAPELAARYMANWKGHLGHSEPYQATNLIATGED